MVYFFTPPYKNRASKPRFLLKKTSRLLSKMVICISFSLLLSSLVFAQEAAPRPVVTILIKMIPEQESWFKRNVLEPFETARGVNIVVRHFVDYSDLDSLLGADSTIDVIKVPMDRAEMFREKEYISPISSIADTAEVNRFRSEFLLPPLAVSERALYYIPRKLETRIMVYRVSKVKEAVAKQATYIKALDKELKQFSGKGLPVGFILKADPNEWDYFDVLAAGYIWSKMDGKNSQGRIGQRAKNYSGTFTGLIDRAFQFGAIRGEIPYLNAKPVTEVFLWEALYSKLGVYNAKMFPENWTGSTLWKTFGDSSIYLSFLTQLDCFFLLGTGENGLTGYMKSPDDIDFSVMPCAVSLSGEEFMLANRNITTGGWFWAVGRASKDKRLSLELIKQMVSEDIQKKEYEAFGVLSARRSFLQENKDELYLKRWRNRMLQTSIRQLNLNRFTILPTYKDMDRLQNVYYRLLYRLCAENGDIYGIENVMGIIGRTEN